MDSSTGSHRPRPLVAIWGLLVVTLLAVLAMLSWQSGPVYHTLLAMVGVGPAIPQPLVYAFGATPDTYKEYYQDTGAEDVVNVIEIDSYDPPTLARIKQKGILPSCHVYLWGDASCLGAIGKTGETDGPYCSKPENYEICIDRMVRRASMPFDYGFSAVSIDEIIEPLEYQHIVEKEFLSRLRKERPRGLIFAWDDWGRYYADHPEASTDMLQTLNATVSMVLEKAYLKEPTPGSSIPANSDEWKSYLDALFADAFVTTAKNMESAAPGIMRKTVFGLGVAQTRHYTFDKNPNIDFKGFLAGQLGFIKGNDITKLTPGIASWAQYYGDTDTLRYFYGLVGSYYRGRGTPGLQLAPVYQTYPQNAGFESGMQGWTITGGGRAEANDYADLGLKSPSYSAVPELDHALYFKRGAPADTVVQKVAVKPGASYGLIAYAHSISPESAAGKPRGPFRCKTARARPSPTSPLVLLSALTTTTTNLRAARGRNSRSFSPHLPAGRLPSSYRTARPRWETRISSTLFNSPNGRRARRFR